MIIGSKIGMGGARENPNLTNGTRAADTEIKIADLDTSTPLDFSTSLASLKDNQKLYFMMLSRFKNSSVIPLVTQIS